MQNNYAFARACYTIPLLALILLCSLPGFSQKWRLITPAYPTTDAPVIGISVADSGATGDGVTDVTGIFQRSLNTLGKAGGGTLFVPKGKYVIKGNLTIPKGITLRGEWQQPVKGQPVVGTILMAYAGRNNINAAAFITMLPSAQAQDLSIWYPEQLPDNIVPYPPAILFGQPNYFGNEFCNTKNITLVNAYDGILFSIANGGTCPVIWNIYGTPLHTGVQLDNIVDVGRMQYLDFSPAYWAGSGLPNAPAPGSGYAGWMYQNGTAIRMGRIDWSNTAFVNVEGYHIGYWGAVSLSDPGSYSNGSNYSLNFSNCNTAVQIDGMNSVGFLFSKVTVTGCANGFLLTPYTKKGALQLLNCTISATGNAISIDSTIPGHVLLKQSTINSGKVNVAGGTFVASDCDFNNGGRQNVIGARGRAVLTGNRYSNGSAFQNDSYFLSSIDDSPLSLPQLPEIPVTITAETHMPSRKVLYLATAAPYNAKPDGITDNTTAIQNALNQAGADGGGIVFLPPGHYKVTGHLTVPANVELKGANDVSSAPTGPGSVLEAYADKGNPGGTPFLRLSAGSGIRGLVFNYPEQKGELVPNFPQYPYTIQGLGSDIYIINIGIRASFNGIDLFTHKCDNHYVDYLAGLVFHNAIRVGASATGGRIYNLHFNTIYYSNGSESKFGSWPNSPVKNGDSAVYGYQYRSVSFMELGDCQNEVLYNDFIYGAAYGLTFLSEGANASGIGLGVSTDGIRKSFNFNGLGTAGFPFINTQNVSLGDAGNSYIVTGPAFTGTARFFNSDYWGNPENGMQLNGGTIDLQLAHFESPGYAQWINAKSGFVNLQTGSLFPNASIMTTGTESHLSVRGTVIDSSGIQPARAALWTNNLGNNWSVSTAGALDRKGWTATASANNGEARYALDSNATTRWSTNGSQTAGQTFTVDMKANYTINRIVLDDTQSPGDNPVGYTVAVSADNNNWTGPIAAGTGNDGMLLILFPETTARYIRITQTGAKGNYWSIHEMYVWGKINTTPVQSMAIPGKIEAEDFDKGGQGVAYNDADTVNSGGQYRATEGVDIETCSEGGFDVGWTNANEWMKYTVNVTTAGVYTIQARVASPNTGSQFYIELNGVNISGTITIPNTNDWQTYTTVTVTTPSLQAGIQTLRIVELTGGFNLNYVTFVRPGARITSVTIPMPAQTVVFPNPVIGKQIHVQLVNQPTGSYHIQLFNHLGQSVYTASVSVTNGHQLITLTPDHKLPPGNYILELSAPNGKPITNKLVIQ